MNEIVFKPEYIKLGSSAHVSKTHYVFCTICKQPLKPAIVDWYDSLEHLKDRRFKAACSNCLLTQNKDIVFLELGIVDGHRIVLVAPEE